MFQWEAWRDGRHEGGGSPPTKKKRKNNWPETSGDWPGSINVHRPVHMQLIVIVQFSLSYRQKPFGPLLYFPVFAVPEVKR